MEACLSTSNDDDMAGHSPSIEEATSYAAHLTDSVNKWLSPLPENVKQNGLDMQDEAHNLAYSDNESFHSQETNERRCEKSTHPKRRIFSFNLQSHHIVKKKQGTSKMYRCDICGATYRHVFSLKRHYLRNHITIKYISNSDINNCKIVVNDPDKQDTLTSENCFRSNASGVSKKQSQSNDVISENDLNPFMPGLYRCHMCNGMTFDMKSELKAHFEMHPDSSRSRFPCKECGNSFSHKQTLLRHMAKHSVSSFHCKSCDLSFDNKISYGKHCATHTSNRTCKYCSKILSTSANKRRHERIHEGLKPYPCRYCDAQFSQSGELKKHLKLKHNEFCITCPVCQTKLSSKVALKKHLLDKHKNYIKTTPEKEDATKFNCSNPESQIVSNESTLQSTKTFSCPICKRSFRNYVNMLRHRRQSHPFLQGKRKPHKRQVKNVAAKNMLHNKFFCRRSPRTPPITDEQFYSTLSQKIADNLVNHVDGKSAHLSLNLFNFNEHELHSSKPVQPWSVYNFPSNFNVQEALYCGRQEVKSKKPQELSTNSFVHSSIVSAGAAPMYSDDINYYEPGLYYSDSDSSDYENSYFNEHFYIDYRNINIEERKKLIGRRIKAAYVCCVCKESFSSEQAFDDHSINNHPNVMCTCIKIEGDEENLPEVPPDLCRQFLSPVGVFCSYKVPPPISDQSQVTCTKCKSVFLCAADLHEHIISCGSSIDTVPKFERKTCRQKRIKHTMKNRMNTTLKPNFNNYHNKRVGDSTMVEAVSDSKRIKRNLQVSNGEKKQQHFKNGIIFDCPNCSSSFKTKSMLNNHKCKSFKRFNSSNKKSFDNSVNETAVNNFVPKPQAKELDATLAVSILNNSVQENCDKLPSPGLKESTVKQGTRRSKDRLSPSLENIVNSIKQKINSEELSPSQASVPWMDDEHLDIPTSVPLNKSVGFQNCSGKTSADLDYSNKIQDLCSEISDKDVQSEITVADTEINNKSDDKILELSQEVIESANTINDISSIEENEVSVENENAAAVDANKPDASAVLDQLVSDSEKLCAKDSVTDSASDCVVQTSNELFHVVNDLDTKSSDLGDAESKNVVEFLIIKEIDENLSKENCDIIVDGKNGESTSLLTVNCDAAIDSLELHVSKPVNDKIIKEKPDIIVKAEGEKEKHKCPYCMLEFAYLTNFRRHTNVCRERKDRSDPDPVASGPQMMLFLPKKDEVEGSLLNLVRHQSRQTQMMKEAAGSGTSATEVKRFQTYTCETCHKIFFSFFQLLKHNVVHKLKNTKDPSSSAAGCSEEPSRHTSTEQSHNACSPGPESSSVVDSSIAVQSLCALNKCVRSNSGNGGAFDDNSEIVDDPEAKLSADPVTEVLSQPSPKSDKNIHENNINSKHTTLVTTDVINVTASTSQFNNVESSTLNSKSSPQANVKNINSQSSENKINSVSNNASSSVSQRIDTVSPDTETEKAKPSPSKEKFPCHFCSQVLSSINYRKRHILTKHKDEHAIKNKRFKKGIRKGVMKATVLQNNRRAFQRKCRKPVDKKNKTNSNEHKKAGPGRKRK